MFLFSRLAGKEEYEVLGRLTWVWISLVGTDNKRSGGKPRNPKQATAQTSPTGGARTRGRGANYWRQWGRRGTPSISKVQDALEGILHWEWPHRDAWIRREVMKSSMIQSARHPSHRIIARYGCQPAITAFLVQTRRLLVFSPEHLQVV